MIKSLEVDNFQSHKKTLLYFHHGVNAITGLSDRGKTSIIRALRWAAWNRPQGDNFRSDWGGATSIGVELDNGAKVERIKDKALNQYLLHDTLSGKPPLRFAGFGADVPVEIQNALQLGEVNLQSQFDRPFLLDNSPGEVAQHFNRIANLEAIDKGLRNIQSWIRKLEGNINSYERQESEYQEQLESFSYLDDFEAAVEKVEEKVKHRDKLFDKAQKLEALLETLEKIDEEQRQLKQLVGMKEKVDEAIALVKQRDGIYARISQLSRPLKQFKSLNSQLERERAALAKLKKRFEEEFPNICPLCGSRRKDRKKI